MLLALLVVVFPKRDVPAGFAVEVPKRDPDEDEVAVFPNENADLFWKIISISGCEDDFP